MCCRLTFSEMTIFRQQLSQFIQAFNHPFEIISDISTRLSEIVVCNIVRIFWWLSSYWFQRCCLDNHKIQISDSFWILQNVVPYFIDTDNLPLTMFPVAFLLSFCLLGFIGSNIFGIVQNICTSDQYNIRRCRHCTLVIFANLPNIFATIFAQASWYLKNLYYALTYMQ